MQQRRPREMRKSSGTSWVYPIAPCASHDARVYDVLLQMRLALLSLAIAAMAAAQIKITPEADRVRVEIDGKHYTDFIERSGEAQKPYLWPLSTASGKLITRHFPMEKVEGEPA